MGYPAEIQNTNASECETAQAKKFLSNLPALSRCSSIAREVQGQLSERCFWSKYLLANEPVCIQKICDASSWSAVSQWVQHDREAPDVHALADSLGYDAACTIVDCSGNELSADTSDLGTFAKLWSNRSRDSKLYMKDLSAISAWRYYNTPVYFTEDHLNAYWDAIRDAATAVEMTDCVPGSTADHRFVYVGMQSTRTPIHHDVLRSFSWSVNVCGAKLWLLFPPGEERNLQDDHGQLVSSLLVHDSFPECPSVHQLRDAIVCIQEPCSAIFVPSGWHHEVVNLSDCISINHNWLNIQSNARYAWEHLCNQLSQIVDDLKHDPDDREDLMLHQDLLERKVRILVLALTVLEFTLSTRSHMLACCPVLLQTQMSMLEFHCFLRWTLNRISTRELPIETSTEVWKQQIALQNGSKLLKNVNDFIEQNCDTSSSNEALNTLGFTVQSSDEVLHTAQQRLAKLSTVEV